MKIQTFALVLLAFALSFRASAQSYSIDWHKVSGGGGTSTNEQFSLSGTIGQPDASSALANGNYSVTGGFWSLISIVQIPGAPLLTITISDNQAIISWPLSVTGFTLQTNGDLAAGTWGNYGGSIVNNTATNFLSSGNLFFRLKQ